MIGGVINSFNSDNLTNDTVYKAIAAMFNGAKLMAAPLLVTAAAGALNLPRPLSIRPRSAQVSADALTLKAASAQSDVALYQSRLTRTSAMHQVQSQSVT